MDTAIRSIRNIRISMEARRYMICAAVIVAISMLTTLVPDNGAIIRGQNKTAITYDIVRDYSDDGMVMAQRTVDQDGNPVADRGSNIAEVRYEYNGMKEVSREYYYGPDGEPAAGNSGVASVAYEYDDNGNKTAYKYYDENGEPAACHSGYAEIRCTFNEAGQKLDEKYYDKDGNPVTSTAGVFGVKYEYDGDGYLINQTTVDRDGNPMTSTSLYATLSKTYNSLGKEDTARYYDINGEAAKAQGNTFTGTKSIYDEDGNRIRLEYQDAAGSLSANSAGVAAIEYAYDDEAHVLSETYYGADNKPVANTSGVTVGGTTVTLTAENLAETDVTISEGYTLALANGIAEPKFTDAHFDGNIYKSASNTAGYTLADNKITYTAAVAAMDLFELSGGRIQAA